MNIIQQERRQRMERRRRQSAKKDLEGAFDAVRSALTRHATNREIQFVVNTLHQLAAQVKASTYDRPFDPSLS